VKPEHQVKQWLGLVEGEHGWFAVFTTGDPAWLLFKPVIGQDGRRFDPKRDPVILGELDIPVRRSDLRPGVLRRLR